MEAIGRPPLGSTNEDTLQTSTQETTSASAYPTPLPTTHEISDNTKITLDDPTWKVLPAALKKHRINYNDWQNYAMFISFGPPGKAIYIYNIWTHLIVEFLRKPYQTASRNKRKAPLSFQETQGRKKESCLRA